MSSFLDVIKSNLINRSVDFIGHEQSMKSAVILPLIEKNGEIHILFQVRSEKLNNQPGEIGFPGGKIDLSDANAEVAAKRELREELGITDEDFEVIAPLDVLVTPFRGVIYPFFGVISPLAQMKINEDEVAEVFTVPLQYLLTTEPETYEMNMHIEPGSNFPLDTIANGHSYKGRKNILVEHFYYYDRYVIWGITARILRHFLQLVEVFTNVKPRDNQ